MREYFEILKELSGVTLKIYLVGLLWVIFMVVPFILLTYLINYLF